MSQVNVIVIHVRKEQAKEFEQLFEQRQLPRWRDYHARGKFINARIFRSQFGTDERKGIAKYVIVVEVPNMAAHEEHDADPEFKEFDKMADLFQPESPLVYGGDLIHSVG
jgi:heme-degrading monooxygenase HmoA